MSGLDKNMLLVIECLAKNRIQDAKKAAIACCANDTTKKNQRQINYCKNLLNIGSLELTTLPANLQGLIHIQDVSDFPENRYYVGTVQRQLYDKIYAGTQVAYRLADYAISYRNGSLIYGLPGTGKTEFAKYVAYKLQIPYIYLNFSNLIESYLGKTAKNLQTVFQYCQNVPCVLMLDEIDCIGLERGHDTGADGELGRTTISLMQCLDTLAAGQVVIAATNRSDRLDKALLRRFRNKVEFTPYGPDEALQMIQKFIKDIDALELDTDLQNYAKGNHSQAETVDYLTEKLGSLLLQDILKAEKKRANQ